MWLATAVLTAATGHRKKTISSLFWASSMPIATRTFRVFVSSTFEDMKEERDALQRDVFPKLRKLCEQHGARFQAIDLRWGVRDEAALDQKRGSMRRSFGMKPAVVATRHISSRAARSRLRNAPRGSALAAGSSSVSLRG